MDVVDKGAKFVDVVFEGVEVMDVVDAVDALYEGA